MDYFYTPPEYVKRETVEIVGDEYNHLVHVMRKKEGDAIRIIDGKGNAYDVTLTSFRRRIAIGKISRRYPNHNEPHLNVHLAVAVLKNPSKFDFLVEKVTELGVRRVIPLLTERAIPKHAKSERWQKLALAAMKQCGRSFLPEVTELQTLPTILESVHSYDIAIVCYESAVSTQPVSSLLRNTSRKGSVFILIGPEGGFSDEEVAACTKAGCMAVSLGPRRLRTETAAVVASALVL